MSNSVAHCFLLALSTGMRAGELCAIKWDYMKKDYVVLHKPKTGPGRVVSLSPMGLRILERTRGWDAEYAFGMKSEPFDANLRKYRERAGLEGFTFHDTCYTATTRLVVKPSIKRLILCEIFGWKQTKTTLTYFNPTAIPDGWGAMGSKISSVAQALSYQSPLLPTDGSMPASGSRFV